MSGVAGTAHRVHADGRMRTAARAGYAANGVIHLMIGALAVALALGRPAESADQTGALQAVAQSPAGLALIWGMAVGFAALGLWQVLEAFAAAGSKEDRAKHVAKEGGKAVAYVVLAGTAVSVALGSGGGNTEEEAAGRLLDTPGGVMVVGVVALAALVIGGYFVVKGARRKFLEDLSAPGGSMGSLVRILGTGGYIAKGVAIIVVGGLFATAALTQDAQQAGGIDQAMSTIAALPFGQVLLVLTGVGFVLFGVYSFFRARYARL